MVDLVTENEALEILGKERVLSCDEVISAWERNSIRKGDFKKKRGEEIKEINWETFKNKKSQIVCSSDTIREMAEKDGHWCLIYIPSFSLPEVVDILDFGSDKKQWFFQDYPWLNNRELSVYYFMTMKPVFPNLSWEGQEQEIKKMGSEFYRPPSILGIMAQISYFLARNDCPSQGINFWGPEIHKIKSVNRDELRLGCVSIVWGITFQIYNWPCDSPAERIGTLIACRL